MTDLSREEQIPIWAAEIEDVAREHAGNAIGALWIICYGIDAMLVETLVDGFIDEFPMTDDAIIAAAHKAAWRRWELK